MGGHVREFLPLFALMAAPVLAGCLTEPSPPQSLTDDAPPPATIATSTQEQLPAGSNPELGAIRGDTLNKRGGVLANVRVLLLGDDSVSTASDKFGRFAFNDVPPGDYTLRGELSKYLAEEVSVTVVKGFVTRLNLSLEPEDPTLYDHTHDYWFVDGQPVTQKVVYEGDVHFPWSLTHHAKREAYPCANADTGADLSLQGLSSPVHYNCWTIWIVPTGVGPEEGIVWPGTKELNVTITWPANEYVRTVSFNYSPANSSKMLPNAVVMAPGQTHLIRVDPPMADTGHQRFTHWRFKIDVQFKIADTVAVNNGDLIWQFSDPFHVKIEGSKGVVPSEPVHPRYWAEGPRLLLLNHSRKILLKNDIWTAMQGEETPVVAYQRDPRNDLGPLAFRLDPGKIVPPGTTHLNITLEYGPSIYRLEEFTADSLGFRTGATNPGHAVLTDLRQVQHTNNGKKATWLYELPTVEGDVADEADVVYGKRSLWLFVLANEGEEQDEYFLNDCPDCPDKPYFLTVEAINNNWQRDFEAGLI